MNAFNMALQTDTEILLFQEQRKFYNCPFMTELAFLRQRWSPLVPKSKKGMLANTQFPNTELKFTVLCESKKVL